MTTRTTIFGSLVAVSAVAALGTAAVAGTNNDSHASHSGYGTVATGKLKALNASGASGTARVELHGKTATVWVTAKGVLAKMPHAMHIHTGGHGTCPTMAADMNKDKIINTTEGHHAYGDIAVSLTTSGDTTPASGLAVDRFPTAPKGSFTYKRDVKVSAAVAKQIRMNNAVIVVHGIDRNGNGKYDFGAGKSDLDPKLPLEATSPAICGPLHMQNGR
ncbi:hypothetical protein [Actinoplanes sp. NPDC051859]|uniref:hypothetical protein n=1 Tax=Actinoplanes sp. NPDC051859 TaxID=3363909 RepID=UPI0037B973BB